MGNKHTKQQIRNFLENAVEKAKHPDKREQIKRERLDKSKKVLKSFGL